MDLFHIHFNLLLLSGPNSLLGTTAKSKVASMRILTNSEPTTIMTSPENDFQEASCRGIDRVLYMMLLMLLDCGMPLAHQFSAP